MIVVDVERVSDSCGYGVPMMEMVGERHLLPEHMERKGDDGVLAYRRLKNAHQHRRAACLRRRRAGVTAPTL